MSKHFLITTIGSAGDIFPFIEIGKQLIKKNQQVTFMTNPYFENVVKTNGLAYVPFGTMEQCLDTLNDPGTWNPKNGFTVIWAKSIRPNMQRVRLFAQSLEPKDTVVILSHPSVMALANLARADRDNLKVVLFYFYPTIIRSNFGKAALGGAMTLPARTPKFLRSALYSWLDKMFFDVGVVPDLNRERKKLGLTAIEHFFPHLQSSADLYVTLFPDWYASTKADYPRPLINGNFVFYTSSDDGLSEELTEFLSAGQPPLLFTAGTGNRHAESFFEIAADVIRNLKVRAIFLTKFREQLPRNLPDSVLCQEYAPLNRILPRVATIVHHGGIGTLAEASKAGIPQLIIPFAYDQFDNAMIVQDLGIGKSIPAQSLTRRKLLSKVLEIQQSQNLKIRCMSIAARFRSGLETNQIVDKIVAAV